MVNSSPSVFRISWLCGIFLAYFGTATGQVDFGEPGVKPNYEIFKDRSGLSTPEASYSGALQFSIPLGEIPGRHNRNFPLTLNYSSNIGQRQYASWVGLGWSLYIGQIERVINGRIDDAPIGSYNLSWGGSVDQRAHQVGRLNGTHKNLTLNLVDQVDSYMLVFPEGAEEIAPFPLEIDETDELNPLAFLPLRYKPWSIVALLSNNYISAFRLKSSEGATYAFSKVDKEMLSGAGPNYESQYATYAKRWHLTRIDYPEGTSTNIHYSLSPDTAERNSETVLIDREDDDDGGKNLFGAGFGTPGLNGNIVGEFSVVDSITTDTHSAVFHTSIPQVTADFERPVEGKRRLDSIRIYDKRARLLIRSIRFGYAVNVNDTSNTDWTPGEKLMYNQETLVSISIRNGNTELPPYLITYGYNPHHVIRKQDTEGPLKGAEYARAWRLKDLTTPTGLKTTYTFENFDVTYDGEGTYFSGSWTSKGEPASRLKSVSVTDAAGRNQLWNYSYSAETVFDIPLYPFMTRYLTDSCRIVTYRSGYTANDTLPDMFRGCSPGHRWVKVEGPNSFWKKTYFTSSYKGAGAAPAEQMSDELAPIFLASWNYRVGKVYIYSNAAKRGLPWKIESNSDTILNVYSFHLQGQIYDRWEYYNVRSEADYPVKVAIRSFWARLDTVIRMANGVKTTTAYEYYGTPREDGSMGSGLVKRVLSGGPRTYYEEWYWYAYQHYDSMRVRHMLSQTYQANKYLRIDTSAHNEGSYAFVKTSDPTRRREQEIGKTDFTFPKGPHSIGESPLPLPDNDNSYFLCEAVSVTDWMENPARPGFWVKQRDWVWKNDVPRTYPSLTDSTMLTRIAYESYDSYGNVLQTKDGNGNVTKYYYGTNWNPFTNLNDSMYHAYLTGIEKPHGNKVSYQYNYQGNVIRTIDENNKIRTFDYDDLGRIIREKDHSGSTLASYSYYTAGQNLASHNPNAITLTAYRSAAESVYTRIFYSGVGNELQRLVSLGSTDLITALWHDSLGRKLYAYKPYVYAAGHAYDQSFMAHASSYYQNNYFGNSYYSNPPIDSPYVFTEYYPDGKVKSERPPGSVFQNNNRYTRYSYGTNVGTEGGASASGQYYKTVTTDENGVINVAYTDRWGNVVRTVSDSANLKVTTRFEYDILKRLRTVFRHNDTLRYEYDTRSLLRAKYGSDFDSVKYLYDKNGNLRLVKDANHSATSGNGVNVYAYKYGTYTETGSFTLTMPGQATVISRIEMYDVGSPQNIVKIKRNGATLYTVTATTANQSVTGTVSLPKGTYQYESSSTGGDGEFSYTVRCTTNLEFVYQKYDSLNRIIEAGEFESPGISSFTLTNAENTSFPQTGRVLYREYGYDTPSADPDAGTQTNLKGRLSWSKAYRLGADPVIAFYSYDDQGRVASLTHKGLGGSLKKFLYYYDYQGNVTKLTFVDSYSTSNQHHKFYEYDAAGRLTKVYSGIYSSGTGKVQEVAYTWYPTGMPKRVKLGNSQGMDYRYNSRDWMTQINHHNINPAQDPGGDGAGAPDAVPYADKFGMTFGYDVKNHIGAVEWLNAEAKYNGNISWLIYQMEGVPFYGPGGDATLLGYTFNYDALNRLTKADFGYYFYDQDITGEWLWGNPLAYDLPDVRYDSLGNIKILKRNSRLGATVDNLTYVYDANRRNRLTRIDDTVADGSFADDVDDQSENNYTYDSNGNIIADAKNQIAFIHYDINNLPVAVYTASGSVASYAYDASGNRVKQTALGVTTYYYNGKEGRTEALGSQNQTQFTHLIYGTELLGYTRRDLGTFTRYYYLKDQIGSVRVIVNETGSRVAWNDFDAYGTLLENRNGTTGGVDLRFKYSSKERDNITGYDYFGARYFDRKTARWMSVDPKAEKYPSWSGYHYVLGNPLVNTDPTGAIIKLKGLTNDQTRAFNQTIQTMLESKLFARVWRELNESKAVYEVGIGEHIARASRYTPNTAEQGSGGIVVFNSLRATTEVYTFAHEMYHAYIHEKMDLRRSIGEEVEANLFSSAVAYNLGESWFSGYGGSSRGEAKAFEDAFNKLVFGKVFEPDAWRTAINTFKSSAYYDEIYRGYNTQEYDPQIRTFYPLTE